MPYNSSIFKNFNIFIKIIILSITKFSDKYISHNFFVISENKRMVLKIACDRLGGMAQQVKAQNWQIEVVCENL